MRIGDLVRFRNAPTKSTPGVRQLNLHKPWQIGAVVGDRYFEFTGAMLDRDPWCDVMWPDGAITRCFKKDFKIIGQ